MMLCVAGGYMGEELGKCIERGLCPIAAPGLGAETLCAESGGSPTALRESSLFDDCRDGGWILLSWAGSPLLYAGRLDAGVLGAAYGFGGPDGCRSSCGLLLFKLVVGEVKGG